MSLIDKLEKLGRLVLWVALAACCVAALMTYVAAVRGAGEISAKLEQAQKELEEARKPKPPDPIPRLTLETFGITLQGMDGMKGSIWLANVSPREGVLCARLTLTNQVSHESTGSMPSCVHVKPYDTNLVIEGIFASNRVKAVCPSLADCELASENVEDGPVVGPTRPVAIPTTALPLVPTTK